MMLRILILLTPVLIAFAQTSAEPEIRGTVIEFGVNAPVAGAEVTISEFVVIDSTLTRKPIATIYADNRGSFAFKPGHIGRFWVEAHREGYSNPQAGSTFVNGMGVSETSADLTQERPILNTNLMLFRPGTLTGRVVDDEDKPVANLMITLIQPNITTPAITAKTDNDGSFTFSGLPASSRVMQISASLQPLEVMDVFTEKNLMVVDRDFEVSYWPGGVREPGPYYRARLKFNGECMTNESWLLMFLDPGALTTVPNLRPAKCRSDILIRMLRPGSQALAIMARNGDSRKWALIPFSIRDENIEAAFNFSPGEDVPIRLIDRDGGQLPAINARLTLNSVAGFAQGVELNAQDPTVHNVVLPRQQILFLPPPQNIAIQEIRYNRLPVLDGAFDVVHGATLEIVLDQQPAVLSFSGVSAEATMLLAKWPLAESLAKLEPRPPYTHYASAIGGGKGRFTGLASGEYRLITVPDAEIPRVRNPQTLLDLLSKGEKITLERGEQKSIEIKR